MEIKKTIKTFFKLLKKAGKSQFFRAKFRFVSYSEKLDIDENLILFEGFMGNSFTGNPFYVFEYIYNNKKYDGLKKVISVNKAHVPEVRALLERYGYTKNVKIVNKNSVSYCRALTTAKYLVNNVSFPTYFVKREGQIFLNTWHGTPLKGLGRSIKDNPNSIGNVQRNFLMADYLLYPNQYSYEHIKEDYMLEQFYKGDYVLAGYPCNGRFFENKKADAIRKEFELEGKRVIVYMPTWRDVKKDTVNKQIYYMMHALVELESKLDDNTVVFVKLHHLAAGEVNLEGFKKVKEFPADYETYDFLSIADGLITDYSSVMFDFANTGKSVYLYTYDKEEYMAGRSVYFGIEELPFFATDDIHSLVNEIIADKTYDYSEFAEKFCTYDNKDAAENLAELLLNGKQAAENMEIIHGPDLFNGKENVLIYTGVLQKNGMTTALKNLVNTLNADKRNYVLTFYAAKTNANKLLINEFQKGVMYMPMQGPKNITIREAVMQVLYYLNILTPITGRALDTIYKRELARLYPGIHFDHAIHFTGYEKHIMQLFGRLDCKKYIWVHNNMYKEAKTKKNFHINSIKYAYENFDKIVVVRDTMGEELKSFMTENEYNKICVVHNQNDVENILTKANRKIEFQDDTYCNVELEQLNEILENKNISKFINIARFSKEKGIDRLITAFDKYRRECDKDAWLIIIGGYGYEFKNIQSMIVDEDENVVTPNIVLIKSIMNPYPILKKCDAFVLSSLYEGLPMTIIEALILDVPVISTDITGPREFLNAGYGHLVDNSEQGLVDGFKAFKNNELTGLTKFDVYKFNKDAMDEFESVFEN